MRLSSAGARVLVVGCDPVSVAVVRKALACRPLEIQEVPVEQLSAWRADARSVLSVVLDLDADGASEAIATEERIGGLLSAAPLIALSSAPPAHAWDDDESASPPPWSVVLAKPIAAAAVFRAIDREIAFASYGALIESRAARQR
jgi:hypothetical protein